MTQGQPPSRRRSTRSTRHRATAPRHAFEHFAWQVTAARTTASSSRRRSLAYCKAPPFSDGSGTACRRPAASWVGPQAQAIKFAACSAAVASVNAAISFFARSGVPRQRFWQRCGRLPQSLPRSSAKKAPYTSVIARRLNVVTQQCPERQNRPAAATQRPPTRRRGR